MPPLDLAITVLVGVFAVLGFGRGFVRGVLDLALLAAAWLVAARFSAAAATVLTDGGLAPGLAPTVGRAAVFLGALVLGSLALRVLLAPARATPWPPPLPFLNRLLGLLPGAAKGAVAAAVLLAILTAWQGELGIARLLAESRLAPALTAAVERGLGGAAERFGLRPPEPTIPLGPGDR